jgi:hypothetical protein
MGLEIPSEMDGQSLLEPIPVSSEKPQ